MHPRTINCLRTFLCLCLFLLINPIIPDTSAKAAPILNTVPGFNCYRSLDQVYIRAEELQTAYPDLAEWLDIGDSWEKINEEVLSGFDLGVLKLSNRDISESKPTLVVISSLRANSFAATEVSLQFAESLLPKYETDADVRWMLDHLEVHLLLIANPDGRLKAENQALGDGNSDDITWAKNSNPQGCTDPSKKGVFLGRNFSYAWSGSSTESGCLADYAGAAAASEPETQAIQNYLSTLFEENQANYPSGLVIDFETYGDVIVRPYLYNGSVENPYEEDLEYLSNKIAFDNFAIPKDSNEVGNTTGSLVDFAYGSLGIPALQLRVGTYHSGGYVADCEYFEDYILPQNLETLWRALKATARPYEYPHGPEVQIKSENYQHDNRYFTLSGSANDFQYYRFPRDEGVIEAVYYAIDIPPWHTETELDEITDLHPNDIDPRIMEFSLTLDTATLKPGKRILYLVAEDSLGYKGLISATFVQVKAYIFLPILIQ